LSYTGGSGTIFRWYTESCGGTLAGTGNDYIVSPTITTTYYGRGESACRNSDCETVTITVSPAPVAPTTINATFSTICDGESTSLSYTGGSGTVFKWYTDGCGTTEVGEGNDFIVSPSVTTTYYGRWENTCGYSDCESITINVNQIAIAPISVQASSTTICSGESTELSYTGGNGDVFNWYTGSCNDILVGTGNNLMVNPSAITTYYGNWTSACNTSDCEFVTITVNPLPEAPTSVQATATTICEGENTTLSYTGGNGDTFKWYTESCGGTPAGTGNDLIITPTTTTTYYGRWENSCGGSDCESVTITVNALAVEPSVVGAGNFSICSGESTHLIYAGGNGDVFKWYLNACGDTEIGEGNSIEVSPTETTTYYGRWESSCGNSPCKSVTITVNDFPVAPDAITADNTSLCSGESVILSFTGGNGDVFKWYTVACGDTEVGTGNIFITTPTIETTYFGRWENACGVSDCESITISVNDLPDVPVAEYECSGTEGAAIITVISPIGIGYTYSLNGFTFQDETVFNNISDGSYVVTVAYNGCTATSNVLEFNCLCDNPSFINLTPTDGIICDNESVFQLFGNTFGGSATEVYVSHNGSGELNEETFTTSPFDIIYTMGADDHSGPITITISSNNPLGDPCSEASEQFVIYTIASPVIELPETVNACAEELFEYTYSGSYSYITWSDESTEDTYTNTFMAEGEYQVWVTVGNFYCESVDTMTVMVTICSDISNNFNEGEFVVYPNPTSNNITLSINDFNGDVTYILFDIHGKEIVSNKLSIEKSINEEISLQNCLPGMYFLKLTTKDETINYKIIKN
ncbi:MAG: T9SS type A sorting domain-containing protein, partial [Bacteroidales bacterium]|nr:T9SS type A sorting domain-containing protein [Bacteroidales bacterium]